MCSNTKLRRLRGDLDRVDEQLLELIDQRLLLCRHIGDAKNGDEVLMLRPDRQKALVARLQDRARAASAEAVRHIWRELMAHGLQCQARTPFILVKSEYSASLLGSVREAYGSAAPVEWAENTNAALTRAAGEHAIAIIPYGQSISLPPAVELFDILHDGQRPIAWVAGRVRETKHKARPASAFQYWHPGSWRGRPALQLPEYDDAEALNMVEQRLARRPSIVELNDIRSLTERLAEAARGEAIVIQGGDCAESFDAVSRERTCGIADLLGKMGSVIERLASLPVVRIGRIAGQMAKPRTLSTETVNGRTIHAYRGDAVNSACANENSRAIVADRLLLAQQLSESMARWLSDHIPDGQPPIHTSHEALLLNFEQAQTRHDELSGDWWAGSGHLLWIGNRTRAVDGAHVEYARGIINPIAVKCGPSISADELLELLAILDPAHTPGRMTLIPRMGAKLIGEKLPPLMRAMAREGRAPLWLIDPMHGNTVTANGYKTRHFDDIRSEIAAFHQIATAEGIWPGGIHLELAPEPVTECLGGRSGPSERGLKKNYQTLCDPRLNAGQAIELAEFVAELYGKASSMPTAKSQ